ncbi:MAG: metallophosphoesterase [Burkholderiales bacterium]|nr:metallophosphoesterase [Burkholderiales bacterium]
MPAPHSSGPPSRLHAAFVVVGENGAATARAIMPQVVGAQVGNACPEITIDGTTQRMLVRASAATLAQRPTASDSASSKPSVFDVTVCEFPLPRHAARAAIGATTLRLPKAEPQRIIVIGDTGCRMKRADNAWQACLDQKEWPFRTIADAAAAMAPDLVIHVGDYHYRENACPPNIPGCQGSPWGYGWDTWQADLFEPAAKLLATAPWVVARGNHEECRRAGQGWFRLLDVRPFEESRSCNDAKNDLIGNFTPPYPLPLAADLQLIMFDSAVAGSGPLDPSTPREAHTYNQYLQQFVTVDALAAKPGVNSIFINHHPILAYSVYDKSLQGGNRALQSVMKSNHPQTYYPAGVQLALHGHVHLFEAISFSSNHPATIVSGIGGDELSTVLPDPFPTHAGPAPAVTLESIVHGNDFGFVVMDKRQSGWQISAHDVHGISKATCILTRSKLRCDKTGLLK